MWGFKVVSCKGPKASEVFGKLNNPSFFICVPYSTAQTTRLSGLCAWSFRKAQQNRDLWRGKWPLHIPSRVYAKRATGEWAPTPGRSIAEINERTTCLPVNIPFRVQACSGSTSIEQGRELKFTVLFSFEWHGMLFFYAKKNRTTHAIVLTSIQSAFGGSCPLPLQPPPQGWVPSKPQRLDKLQLGLPGKMQGVQLHGIFR